jgi:hypothetical protein
MSHHRDNPNAVQRAFTERQKALRKVKLDPGYRPPLLCPDCGVNVSKVICVHFAQWLKEINDEFEESRRG